MIRLARPSSRLWRVGACKRTSLKGGINWRLYTETITYKSFPTATGTSRGISSTSFAQSGPVFSSWAGQGWQFREFLRESSTTEKEDWLASMLDTQYKQVDAEAFLVVLNALADETNDRGASRRAERWMKRLKEHRIARPTPECYQAAIRAWANAGNERIEVVVNRAERWLNEIIEEEKQGGDIQPTIECFNAFLDACTRGRSGKNKRNQSIVKQNAQKADAIFRRLHSEAHHYGTDYALAPNSDTYNLVIRGWTRCKDDDLVPQKILELLRLMEAHQRKDPINSKVRPTTKSYSMVMDALVSMAGRKALLCTSEGDFIADRSLNGVQEINEAAAILKYMHDLYDAGVEGIVPHTVPYNILLTGYANMSKAKHHNAPLKAEEILRKMLSHKDKGFVDAAPDRISFEKVMLAWAHSGHPNAGQRATWWLKKLWNDSELESNAKLLPTTQTYNIAIQALASSDGPLAAENLLLDLGDKYKEEQCSSLHPNSESFAIVTRAWLGDANNKSKSSKEGVRALRRATDWLLSLREVQNETNLSTSPELYVGILKAAVHHARHDPEVFEIATRTFNDMKESRHRLTYVIYGLVLDIALTSPVERDYWEERSNFVVELFQDCCDDGLLSHRFVRRLGQGPYDPNGWTVGESQQFINTWLSDWPLPRSWTRNMRHPKALPTRSDLRQPRDPHTTSSRQGSKPVAQAATDANENEAV